jgi:uncharacterized membrane protein
MISRRRPDWASMGLTVAVWICTLPLVILLIVPWLGVRVGIVTALVLLVVLSIVCWILCAAGRVELGRSNEER